MAKIQLIIQKVVYMPKDANWTCNVMMSWEHDEYIYLVSLYEHANINPTSHTDVDVIIKKNETEMLYIIRDIIYALNNALRSISRLLGKHHHFTVLRHCSLSDITLFIIRIFTKFYYELI